MTPLFFPLKQELQNSIPLARRRQSLLSQTLSYSLMFKERQELGDRHKVQKVGRPGDLEQGGRERVRSRALTLALVVPKKSPILGFCVYADMYLCICVCVCLYVCIYVYLKNFFSFPESV